MFEKEIKRNMVVLRLVPTSGDTTRATASTADVEARVA
jgi:hypothetical protein